jgi:hypothetical protein
MGKRTTYKKHFLSFMSSLDNANYGEGTVFTIERLGSLTPQDIS